MSTVSQSPTSQPPLSSDRPTGSTAVDRPDLDSAAFWRWVWTGIRPVLGYVLVAAGFLALAIGWYGVSGEVLVAKQLPYLISGGLVGLGLIAVGARFLIIEDLRRDSGRLDRVERMVGELHASGRLDRVEQMVGELHALLLQYEDANASAGSVPQYRVVPGRRRYHRPGCTMLDGKPKVTQLTPAAVAERGLSPCPLCEPEAVAH